MFNNIARRYDFLNHFLSLGIDRYWRKKAIQILGKNDPKLILDVATGTGDFAIEAMNLNPVKIYGIDISVDMLELGRIKIKKKNLQDKIELLEGDSEQLFFDDNKFDAVTVAFGVRNFQNLEKGVTQNWTSLFHCPHSIAIGLQCVAKEWGQWNKEVRLFWFESP